MNIVEYLRRFLNEQPLQEAAVLGLGVFYIGEQDGKNKILFKETMPTDKAFLNFFAFEENLSEEDAKAEMSKWVLKVTSELKANGSVRIDRVGVFEITSGQVVFTPAPDEQPVPDQNFGLGVDSASAAPAPSFTPMPDSAPEPAPAPTPAPAPAPRPNNQRKPLSPPIKRPQPNAQPTSSGRGLILEDRKGDKKLYEPRPPKPAPKFYTQWWFFLICALVVLVLVFCTVQPLREKIMSSFKTGTTEMMMVQEGEEAMAALAEAIDKEAEAPAVQPAAKPAPSQMEKENEEVARQVKSGQENKKRQEAQAKKPEAPKAADKPAKPEPKAKKPEAPKAAAKPEPKGKKPAAAPQADVKKPQAGAYYIVVGSFTQKDNAKKKRKEMLDNGYIGTIILHMEARNQYYVSVKTCANRDEAVAERTAFRARNVDCWIFAN